MRSLRFLILCLALSFPVLMSAAAAEQRVLAIAAPSPADDTYRTQAALLLPVWSGLLERDFVVQTRFGAEAFSVILIGKDGGEKLRRPTPLSPEELFAIVEAMPMRRAEMRERK